MNPINIHEAKTQLSKLIEAVEAGEEVIIARAGRPVARLVPFVPVRPERKPGLMKGQFEVPDSFFDPLPDDILEYFEGKK
ncbi:MAG: type II toxin-antitoxin system Phd/YefM family antitoxin [Burkholderiaceae bacterium]|nr:type II toxin-antitoxin system Phd/YefM family antitoxin [Burkholderiaceae bacterium]